MPSVYQERDQLDQLSVELATMYRGTESRLTARLLDQVRRGLRQHPDDVVRALRLSELRKAAEDEVRRLGLTMPAMADIVLSEAAGLGDAAAQRDLAGVVLKQESTAVIMQRQVLGSKRAAEAVAGALVSQLTTVHPNILRWADDVYRKATAQSAQDVLLGVSTSSVAQKTAWQRLVAQGVTGFTDKAGKRWNLGTYVEMSTRSATRRAWDEQHKQTQLAAGVGLCTIIVGSGACKECSAWSGMILRVDGGPTGRIKVPSAVDPDKEVWVNVRGTLDDARSHGWRHPNCRCRQVAYLPGLTAVSDQQSYDPQAEADRARLRELERQVRAAKADAEQAVSPTVQAAAKKRVRALQGSIREHVASTGLARQPDRERLITPPPPAKPVTGPSAADKIRNAATMFGTGSPQHREAQRRFG